MNQYASSAEVQEKVKAIGGKLHSQDAQNIIIKDNLLNIPEAEDLPNTSRKSLAQHRILLDLGEEKLKR